MRARECCHLRFLILLSIYFFNKKTFRLALIWRGVLSIPVIHRLIRSCRIFLSTQTLVWTRNLMPEIPVLLSELKKTKLYYKNLKFNLLYTPSGLGILFCCLTTGNIQAIQMHIQMQIQLKVYVQDFFLSAFYESVIFINQKCEQFFHCMD